MSDLWLPTPPDPPTAPEVWAIREVRGPHVLFEFARLDPETLAIMVDALFKLNLIYFARYPTEPILYQTGTRYQKEPKFQERFVSAQVLRRRRRGDCEDLACDVAAWRVIHGETDCRPDILDQYNPKTDRRVYHIRVRRHDQTIEDPSARLGMR